MATAGKIVFLQPSGVTQCGSAELLWSGGTPPYSVVALSAQSALDSRVLATPGSSSNIFLSWSPVTIVGGTLVKFRVMDASNPPLVADTSLLSIGDSADDSCLPASLRTSTTTGTRPPATSPSPSSAGSTTKAVRGLMPSPLTPLLISS
ncbi:hypothetical protein EXIGLDRAFT_43334 [Exidia glandulosa HHB12029]|uniref:Uncharacterized protein n=1 Tax=Exidia glandulosa HHB12029 TaxID=1314781 RepID=A0A165IJU7_EXIGL|nr:hypothetical protein EXIGLDRAFT_43334 [Exidia glandulosa HHB12029]